MKLKSKKLQSYLHIDKKIKKNHVNTCTKSKDRSHQQFLEYSTESFAGTFNIELLSFREYKN